VERDEAIGVLREVAVEILSVEPDKVTEGARFKEDLDADSLDLVEFVMALEERFNVRVRWIPFQLRVKGKGERSVYSEYKVKYASIRDRGERVVIDGICNSACTLVLGIVPLNRVCVTPRASLGFHMAYFDKSTTAGVKVMSYEGTADVMSYYPHTVKDWLNRHGGLSPNMKKVRNGPELWAIVDPCPDEIF